MATKPSTSWDPNAPETEQDAIQAEALRRSKVRRLSKGLQAPTLNLSPSQNNTPETTVYRSGDKPPMYR